MRQKNNICRDAIAMFAMPIVTRSRNHREFTSLELNKVGRKVLLFLKAEVFDE